MKDKEHQGALWPGTTEILDESDNPQVADMLLTSPAYGDNGYSTDSRSFAFYQHVRYCVVYHVLISTRLAPRGVNVLSCQHRMPLEPLITGSNTSMSAAPVTRHETSTTEPTRPHDKMAHCDVESAMGPESKLELRSSMEIPEEGTIIDNYVAPQSLKSLLKSLATAGVELRGLEPVPLQERTHTKYYNIFTLFGGSFISLLP